MCEYRDLNPDAIKALHLKGRLSTIPAYSLWLIIYLKVIDT